MSADHAPDQTLVGEMVEPAILSVALAGRIEQGQVARPARGEEALFERERDSFGEAGPAEPARADRIAIADQPDRFGRRDDLAGGRTLPLGDLRIDAHGGSDTPGPESRARPAPASPARLARDPSADFFGADLRNSPRGEFRNERLRLSGYPRAGEPPTRGKKNNYFFSSKWEGGP